MTSRGALGPTEGPRERRAMAVACTVTGGHPSYPPSVYIDRSTDLACQWDRQWTKEERGYGGTEGGKRKRERGGSKEAKDKRHREIKVVEL